MKRILLILCTLIPSTLFAQSSPDNHALAQQEIKTYFKNYLAHFNQYLKDPSDKAALVASSNDVSFPSVLIGYKGTKQIASNHDFIIKSTQGFINALRQQGISQIKWKSLSIKPLNSHTAIASNTALLYKADDTLFREIAGTYLLHKNQDGWKLFSRIQHTPERSITF